MTPDVVTSPHYPFLLGCTWFKLPCCYLPLYWTAYPPLPPTAAVGHGQTYHKTFLDSYATCGYLLYTHTYYMDLPLHDPTNPPYRTSSLPLLYVFYSLLCSSTVPVLLLPGCGHGACCTFFGSHHLDPVLPSSCDYRLPCHHTFPFH